MITKVASQDYRFIPWDGHGMRSCTEFEEGYSTSFGFSLKPVTVAKWQSDLVKGKF